MVNNAPNNNNEVGPRPVTGDFFYTCNAYSGVARDAYIGNGYNIYKILEGLHV